jgi:hypothetical protein
VQQQDGATAQPEACDVCGGPVPAGTRVALAARYLEPGGDEMDVDVVLCSDEHARQWVASHHPIEVSLDDEPGWRTGPASTAKGAVGCVGIVLLAVAILVGAAYLIGRLRGGG